MKKTMLLITVGVLNSLHGLLHIIQFLQSVLLATSTHNEHVEHILENPLFSFLMGCIGVVTLIIGIRDYRHHKNCHKGEA